MAKGPILLVPRSPGQGAFPTPLVSLPVVAQVRPVSGEAPLDCAELREGRAPTLCQVQRGHQWGGEEMVGEPCPLLVAESNWFFRASPR